MIGIGLIITRLWPIKVGSRTIRKGLIRHLILPSLMRKSACIVAARSFATISIARATSLGRAAKVRSTPAQIILVFDASDRRRTSRSAQVRINFCDGQPLSIPIPNEEFYRCMRQSSHLGLASATCIWCRPSGQRLAPEGLIHRSRRKQYTCPPLW